MRTKIRRKSAGSHVRWYVASIDADGRETSHGGYARRSDAKAAAAKLMTESPAGRLPSSTKITLGQFLEREWLPSREGKIAPSTLEGYTWAVSAWIVPHIGSIVLQSLAVDDLERLYADLRAGGGRRGRPLSGKTVRNAHLVLSKALGLAVRRGYIAANPAAMVEWTKEDRRPEREAWTVEEARAFLLAARDDRLYAVWRLMLSTGVRRGEILGASWDVIDLKARTLAVRQQLLLRGRSTTTAPRLYVRETTKGRRPRTVTFDEATRDSLSAWKAQQATERLAFGPAWHTDGGVGVEAPWLVTEPNGLVIHPDTLHDRFIRLTKDASVRQLVLHGTRHSFATIALASGVRPDVVSRALGHASTGFTLDQYVHPGDDERTAAADVMGAAFGDAVD